MFSVGDLVIAITVDPSDFNLIARSRSVYQIMQDDTLFLARDTTRWYSTRRLLYRKLLVVPVHSVKLIKLVGSLSLAPDTSATVHLGFLDS